MSGHGGDRGQINFDFAIGVSILMITVVIAFSFVPSVFGGVTEGRQQSDKVAADRISEWVVTEGLASPDNPGELRVHCTNSFFSSPSDLDHCGFDSDDVTGNVPGDYDRFIQITVEHDGDLQCWSGADWRTGNVQSAGAGGCHGTYVAGNDPPTQSEVGVSRRGATLANQRVVVVVRVW